MNICVLAESPSLVVKGEDLAKRLGATFLTSFFQVQGWKAESKRLSNELTAFKGALLVHNEGLSLLPLEKLMSPIHIDFTNAAWTRRLFNISSKTELAAKALSLKKNASIDCVFDANAGLGQDSFVFAALGSKVIACERSLLVYLLLEDALHRARLNAGIADIVERIQLLHADSSTYLKAKTTENIDAIFLDPMFPDKKNQALAKKEMQIFQSLLGEDDDAEQLFQTALTCLYEQKNVKRLVLKRPKSAPVLNELALGHQVIGKATRFDIYFKLSI